MNQDFDVAIIGAGPAGLSAAIYLRRYNLTCCIIEKMAPGGTLLKIDSIENYPGFEKIKGFELATNMYNQAIHLDTEYISGEVVDIEVKKDYKIIKTKTQEITCRGVILATGRVPRSLGLTEEEKLVGKGISYCATCDGPLFKNESVAVVGGGNSAFEEALYLSDICKKVTIIHHNDSIKADPIIYEKVKSRQNIKILLQTDVKKYLLKDSYLDGLELVDQKSKKNKKLKVKGCFLFIGQIPDNLNFQKLGIVDENGYIDVDENYKTRIDGIYAVGDTIKKSVYQVVTAASEGAIAATNLSKELRRK